MGERLLEVRGLKTHFKTDEGWVHAVDGVDLWIDERETLGIVGESGCGKSVTAFSIMRLIPIPPAKIAAGEIVFRGRDLVKVDEAAMRAIRAREIAMVFQEPMTSLNPVYSVGEQIAEVVRLHQGLGRRAAIDRAAEMLRLVRIPHPERRVHDFPHQFSGGMRQRVMIAMALINSPDLLIADEPTTALDVTTQAQILNLMLKLQEEFHTAIIMITHDLGVVAEIADDVVVMYAGRVAEEGTVDEIFTRPHHPYTWGLLGSLPRLDADVERLVQIQGQPPSLLNPPKGCRFHPRCPYVMEVCKSQQPALLPVSDEPDHLQACHLDEQTKDREVAKLLEGTLAEVG
jgi:oligopeptide/dipeptide ABC transporter ATP-binding protein